MKLIRDIQLIYGRSFQVTLRNPVFVIFGLFNPLCLLFLFAPLLGSLAKSPGFPSGNALSMFVPGLLIMIALYGSSFVGFGLLDDVRSGVLERFKVTPLSRSAILFGMVLRDVTVLLAQAILMLVFAALFFGLSLSLSGVCATLALVSIIGFAIASFSYSVALAVGNEDALAATVNFFIVPTQLLAGIMLPLTLAPLWLQRLSYINPLSYAVSAARVLCAGNGYNQTVLFGFVAVLLLLLVCCTWGVRSFKKNAV